MSTDRPLARRAIESARKGALSAEIARMAQAEPWRFGAEPRGLEPRPRTCDTSRAGGSDGKTLGS